MLSPTTQEIVLPAWAQTIAGAYFPLACWLSGSSRIWIDGLWSPREPGLMRQRPLCSGGRLFSRVELSCTVVGALLCSVPPCSALLSEFYSALHCCQSRRRRRVSLCPRERELLLLCSGKLCTIQRRAERAAREPRCSARGKLYKVWQSRVNRRAGSGDGGRWEEGSPDPRPLSTAVHTATNLHAIRLIMSFLSTYS